MTREISPRARTPAPLMTIKEAVRYTRVSEKTLRRAIANGRLRAFRLPGGLRFRVEDVDVWLESYAVQVEPRRKEDGHRTLSGLLS